MTLAEAHEIMRREVISLRHENERLKKGTYVSPEEKELKKLKSEIARLEKERDRYHSLWRERVESSSYWEERRIESPLATSQKREYEAKIELLEKANAEKQKAIFALQQENEQLKTGKIIASKDREIQRLKAENARLVRARDQYHKLWRDVNLQNRIFQQDQYFITTSARIGQLEEENRKLTTVYEFRLASIQQEMANKEEKIRLLEDEILRLRARLNTDSSNSSFPTSKTPVGKKKIIPNSRIRTGKRRGGQEGHAKAKLSSFEDEEITNKVEHTADQCPHCSGAIVETGRVITKDEGDYEIRIIKNRHEFYEYRCLHCGKTFHSPIPLTLKEENQYGPNIQALILTLLNSGFVSIARTQQMLCGLLNGQMTPSAGYIVKVQARTAKKLEPFVDEVKRHIPTLKVLHWDDTVVFVDARRTCMRFYGDERVALYTAHEKKDRNGLEMDGILANLSSDTVVMHDHNSINYNADFHFQNIECNAHLLRDIQKLADITPHKWPSSLKSLIQDTLHARKLLKEKGKSAFPQTRIQSFNRRVSEILEKGRQEYNNDEGHFYHAEELRLLNRLEKYRGNYFAWLADFSLPTTNNIAERSLRGIKTKEKVSGQFLSEESAEYFACIRTYAETCSRNGINPYNAFMRLLLGEPYTLSEILSSPTLA